MSTRNSSTTGTIPQGVSQVGTLTSATGNPRILTRTTATIWVSAAAVTTGVLKVWEGKVYKNLTGTNTATEPQDDKTNWEQYHTPTGQNLWVYVPNDGAAAQKVAKITGVSYNFNERDSSYQELYHVDRDLSTTGAVAFEIVEGTLKEWGVDNTGGAAGVLDGTAFAIDEIRNEYAIYVNNLNLFKTVITFNATGTNFYITET